MFYAPNWKNRVFKLRLQLTIYEHQRGLFYRQGKLIDLLKPGQYTFWRWEPVEIQVLSIRQMSSVISGQEMLTADHIDVRVTVAVYYSFADPVKVVTMLENANERIYQDIQLALRAAVTSHDLDTLLNDRSVLGDGLMKEVTPIAAVYGVEITGIGVKDIILPKNIRDVMLLEVEADRAGRADLIRARHEVAAARTRANAAKIMAENPLIVRMQALDTLAAVAGGAGNVVVLPALNDIAALLNHSGE